MIILSMAGESVASDHGDDGGGPWAGRRRRRRWRQWSPSLGRLDPSPATAGTTATGLGRPVAVVAAGLGFQGGF